MKFSNLLAMASTLLVMASTLVAMAPALFFFGDVVNLARRDFGQETVKVLCF